MKYFVLMFCLLYRLGTQAQLFDKLIQLRPDTP